LPIVIEQERENRSMALRARSYLGVVVAISAALLAASAGYAQVASTLEQAELAGLNPQTRAEVEARMKQGGQTVSEILTTILLNSIKLKHLGSQIVALDFNRGIAVVRTARSQMRTVNFDTTTLQIKS
jgi:hypothetical protein